MVEVRVLLAELLEPQLVMNVVMRERVNQGQLFENGRDLGHAEAVPPLGEDKLPGAEVLHHHDAPFDVSVVEGRPADLGQAVVGGDRVKGREEAGEEGALLEVNAALYSEIISEARMLCPVTRLQIEVGFEATKSSYLYQRSLEAGGRSLCSAQ